jgi:hypothetical protein
MRTYPKETVMQSFLTNNVVISRGEDGGIFHKNGETGEILARLDGYVIVPKEQIKDIDGFLGHLVGINANPAAPAI